MTIGHLRNGATPEQLESQIRTVNVALATEYPKSDKSTQASIRPLRTALLGEQDPDVILVGEIRDPETAQIATQAALTGSPGVINVAHKRRADGHHAFA